MSFFEGQKDHLNLTIEQVKALASPERNQVFWTFEPKTPHTVAEVAAITRKSRQTVHHHVAALVKAGLLIAVGTMPKRSRTETLYSWAAADYTQDLKSGSEEFHQESRATFHAAMRLMGREVDQLFEDAKEDPEVFSASVFRHIHLNLSPEQARSIRRKIIEFLMEAESQHSNSPEAKRYHFVVYANPALRTKSRRKKE